MIKGVYCTSCSSTNLDVIDSRPKENGIRWRRYKCADCGHRFNTCEIRADLFSVFLENWRERNKNK